MSLRVLDYLEHILQALTRIDRYTAGLKEEEFLTNELIQDGVIRNLEVMGEAAKNIELRDSSFAASHPELMLKDIYLMRNRLTHGYFSVDMGIVWNTVQRDLPDLKLRITKAYEILKSQPSSTP
ncbi:MAG TPA: DUF86 domain-containing protein [Alloacidobacterium sp.]|nr:DUF86 domain-containing protein [Alloacidobacterium sp.]